MNLRNLSYAVAVADLGHFSRAAERCGVSQPTLSLQIRSLEQQLGVTLFERGAHPVRLTPVGERLIGLMRDATANVDALLCTAEALRASALAPDATAATEAPDALDA